MHSWELQRRLLKRHARRLHHGFRCPESGRRVVDPGMAPLLLKQMILICHLGHWLSRSKQVGHGPE